MELSEYNAKTQEILSSIGEDADQGKISNLLAELTTGFSEEVAAKAAATKSVEVLTAKNTKLKEDNMNLFLRVTVPDDNSKLNDPQRPETDPNPVNQLFTNGRLNLKG